MAEQLKDDDFMPHVDKAFRVVEGRHALTLTAVEAPRMPGWEAAPRPPFTLIFRGPPGDVLAEGLYAPEVEGGPSFQLYVMPIPYAGPHATRLPVGVQLSTAKWIA